MSVRVHVHVSMFVQGMLPSLTVRVGGGGGGVLVKLSQNRAFLKKVRIKFLPDKLLIAAGQQSPTKIEGFENRSEQLCLTNV